MQTIDNQPVIFSPSENLCTCESIEYNQLVDVGDVTQFQIKLDYCSNEENLISNGAFNDDTDWGNLNYAISDNTACADNGTNAALWQTGIFKGGNLYMLEFTINSISEDCELNIFFGNNNLITTITSTGTHRVVGFAWDDGLGSALSDALIFVSTNSDICISNVMVYELATNVGFAIKDNNGDIVASAWLQDYVVQLSDGVFGNVIGYAVQSDLFELGTDGYLTIKVDWGALEVDTHGCYTIGLLDACEQEYVEFDLCDSGQWTEAIFGVVNSHQFTNVTSDTVTCTYEADGNAGSVVRILNDHLFNGLWPKKYRITYTISGSGFEVYFNIGCNESTHRTSSGTYTEEIKGVTGCGDQIYFWIGSAGGAWTATLSNIHIHIAHEDLITQQDSNIFKLGSYSCKTLLIQVSSDSDVFGLSFTGNTFMPSIRVEGQLDKAQYRWDRNTQESSLARFRNIYFQRYKDKRMYISHQPEYVHDFLSLLGGYDHLYIDTNEYVVTPDQEYVVNYDGSDFLGNVAIEVREKENLLRNQVCGEEGTGTIPPPIFIVDEATGNYILLSEVNNEQILAENQ